MKAMTDSSLSEPAVPWASMPCCVLLSAKKEVVSRARTPLRNSIRTQAWSWLVTRNFCPAFGPEATVRSARRVPAIA